jgi:Domain of unknown function (DUF4160)
VPRLCEFYGIFIYMYFADHNPPHVHAIYAEHEALIAIEDGSAIGGELPKTATHLVEQWRVLHRVAGPTPGGTSRQLDFGTGTFGAFEDRASQVVLAS